jgi:hypothetical protein
MKVPIWSPELINCLIVHICGPDLGTDSVNHNLWEMIAIRASLPWSCIRGVAYSPFYFGSSIQSTSSDDSDHSPILHQEKQKVQKNIGMKKYVLFIYFYQYFEMLKKLENNFERKKSLLK